jgi:dimethylaniline monooxygenase (N-oxide forming)
MDSFDVVVLGGGWSGLLALKHALAEGLRAVAVEAREASGGVWRFTEDPALVTVMANTETTSSTCFTEMADFPMPKDREFLRHDEVLAYLERYIERFDLGRHLRFGQEVEACTKVDGLWRVSTRRGLTFTGKNLAVCTGIHQRRNTALADELFGPGGPGSRGPRVRHMGELKRLPGDLDGARVMVLGGGESASDIIEEMMQRGRVAKVVWSIPHGQHFFRKYGYWVKKVPFTGRVPKPEAFDKQASLLQGLLSPAYKGKDGMRWGCKWTTSGSMLAYQGHGIPEWRNHAGNMHAFVNKSANVLDYVDYQRLVPKGAVASALGKKVLFRDGTAEEVDHVILCTGYLPDFPFLPEAIRDTSLTDHYKYVFCNDDPSVAFIGFVRPVFGSIPLISEVQSRWAAKVFAGRLRLPETAKRVEKTHRERAFWEGFFKDTSRRISTLVDIFIYTHGIARMTGDFPDRRRLFREDLFAWYLSVVGPYSSAMLALNDPATREQAKDLLDHHRLIRWDTMPYLGLQVAAKLTRFDRLLAVLEDVKYDLQRSPLAAKLGATPAGRLANAVLSWPRRRFFMSSQEYPWRARPPEPEPAPRAEGSQAHASPEVAGWTS